MFIGAFIIGAFIIGAFVAAFMAALSIGTPLGRVQVVDSHESWGPQV